ncbi:MAG: right-handed parallel beta-helix repeat-containing protein [Bacteroidetes bacterium]|nr:right-handed parallel beta-helix repeat-containing protein [Bacteroidota bacterium]
MGWAVVGFGQVVSVAPPGGAPGVGWPAVTQTARPWTRWWWMGSAVDRAGLTWNLEQYKAAGLGGMELTPIYGVKGYESRFIDYLSPSWVGMLEYTLREARRLGLGLDMSTGTGWPFGGGPLIDSTYACKELFFKSWVLEEGRRLPDTIRYMQEPYVHTDGRAVAIDRLVEPVFANKDLQGLALFQVRFARRLPLQALVAVADSGERLDLTSRVRPDGSLDWTAPAHGGRWRLYGAFQGMHGKMVERAAPGAEGNVIDHFSAVALKKYLSRFDTAFAGHDLAGLRCYFNDSYEVDDARGLGDWTPKLFEEFRRRRGYDLRLYLPQLFTGDGRVLCDYRETISDLLLDDFTRPWGAWARGRGALIRNQAHGSPANILDLYAASDIPETEGGEVLRYKWGTSAAHVAGKRLASAETVTWLDEHFLSSYADVKKALDNYWLGGVNHVFYHGTAYTPKDDPWPGWLFYAAVHFTPNDPAWRDVGVLNSYVARVQSFLQQGEPDNDVLLYAPFYDSWMEGFDGGDVSKALLKHYDRMEPEFRGTGFEECAEWMVKKGYGFDYISDKQMVGLAAAGNEVVTSGGARYKVILVPGCKYMSVGAMKKLDELAKAGVSVVFYRSLPVGPPGYGDLSGRTEEFRGVLSGADRFVAGDDLVRLLGDGLRERMVEDSLDCVRRSYGGGKVYFIVNHGTRPFAGKLVLRDGGVGAVVYNPMTGEYGAMAGGYLSLRPGESCLVQTLDRAVTAPAYRYYGPAGAGVELGGEWKLGFESGGPVIPAPMKVQHLKSWVELGLPAFSGTVMYTYSFARPAGSFAAWELDLGKVRQTAEVYLNGKKIAALIGPDYTVVIPVSDMRNSNILEVRVSSGMLNRVEDLDRRGVVWKKFYNTNFPAHERGDRGADGLFDATKLPLEEAGLMGPVRLVPVKRVMGKGMVEKGVTVKMVMGKGMVEEGVTERGLVVEKGAVETGVTGMEKGVAVAAMAAAAADPAWTKEVGARVAPSGRLVVSVNNYGVAKDGSALSTKAIQSAIDDCSKQGGGVVEFEPGTYLTGSVFLKEGVELRIGKGVELKGSQHFEDYPEIRTRIAGIEMKWPAALLNVIGVKRAAVTGEGTVNAQGKFCWDKYWAMRREYDPKGLRWIVDYDAKRVRTLLIQDAADITVRGIRFVDAGFWTVQVLYSKYVTVDGITVRNNEDGHGPSTDGVDIDSSSWVLVENCDIDCNDDDFCLKAGRDWDGLRVNRPTEYVVIRNCTARKGGGLLTIGSETSGGIRHVLATDLTAKGTGNGFHIKSATTRGGTVEDIHIRNFTMDSVGNAILFTMNWNPAYSYSTLPAGYNIDSVPEHWKTMLHKVEPAEKGIPHFRDIYISGMKVRSARRAIEATGLDQSMISGVHIDNMTINAATAGEISYARDWEVSGAAVTSKDGSKVLVQHSTGVNFK